MLLHWIVINDQPFNVTENKEFKNMMKFIRPGIQIPSADTVKRDLIKSFKNAKEIFQKKLQVNRIFNIIKS